MTVKIDRLKDYRLKVAEFWRRYKKSKAAILGFAIIISFITIAIFAPILAPYDPWYIDFSQKFQKPNMKHLMGTDQFGRDILSRIIWGSRVCLMIGFIAASISALIGVSIGATSGYYGGKVDDVLMRFTEMFQVIPRFFLILLIVSLFGGSVWNVMIVIGLTSWPGTARLVRAEFLSLKEREFVEAARLVGAKDFKIIFRHILPNALSPVIVSSSLRVAGAILSEAGLSFLGLGDLTKITWGQMLNRSQHFMRIAWWMAVFPGLMIFITVLSFNLIGDGLNDALNPRLKEK
jgi:peptide/nickel transport system permease protein